MHKKSFLLVSAIFVVLFVLSGVVYANNDMQNDIKNGVSDTVNGVVDGVDRLGSDVRNGIGSAENGIEDALKVDDIGNGENNNQNNPNNNAGANVGGTTGDNYTATRTATDLTGTSGGATDNTTLWVWLIVAIAAIVIIGLVWYYGAQNTTHKDE